MKNLYILRHSKAGHTDKNLLDDHARTLTIQGVERCFYLASHLKKTKQFPEIIISSSATRAVETAQNLITGLDGKDIDIKINPKLYLASTRDILRVIREIDDNINSVMIVGHNPGLQQLAIELPGKGDKKKYREIKSNFAPASMAIFDIDIKSWSEIKPRAGELKNLVAGKSLKKTSRSLEEHS